ncbi:MAG: alpha/beta hydrolase [Pseudomonadota bacterium]
MAAPDQTFDITVGGDRLEAARWPGSAGAPLVLLHEGLGSVGLWRDTPARLRDATGRTALAWSRAGYGRSTPCIIPRPLDYMEREAQHLPTVLDALGAEEAVLVGHSDGGSIAALAGASPRIRALVLIAPHFFVEQCSVEAIAAAREEYETGTLRERLARHHDHVDAAFRGWNDAWLSPAFRDWDITACLDRIACPILAVQGMDDPYGTRAQVDVIARHLPVAQIHLIDSAGHAPHAERPEIVIPLLARFVGQLP